MALLHLFENAAVRERLIVVVLAEDVVEGVQCGRDGHQVGELACLDEQLSDLLDDALVLTDQDASSSGGWGCRQHFLSDLDDVELGHRVLAWHVDAEGEDLVENSILEDGLSRLVRDLSEGSEALGGVLTAGPLALVGCQLDELDDRLKHCQLERLESLLDGRQVREEEGGQDGKGGLLQLVERVLGVPCQPNQLWDGLGPQEDLLEPAEDCVDALLLELVQVDDCISFDRLAVITGIILSVVLAHVFELSPNLQLERIT